MPRIAVLTAVLLCLIGCGGHDPGWALSTTNASTDPSVITVETPKECAGTCVTVAPATFTGPSLFWFGLPDAVPKCPSDVPNQGIEGFVDDSTPWFARECLVTPSDLCTEEGE